MPVIKEKIVQKRTFYKRLDIYLQLKPLCIHISIQADHKAMLIGGNIAVLNILLTRSGREEQALMVTITGLVIVLVLVVQKISELFGLIKSLFLF